MRSHFRQNYRYSVGEYCESSPPTHHTTTANSQYPLLRYISYRPACTYGVLIQGFLVGIRQARYVQLLPTRRSSPSFFRISFAQASISNAEAGIKSWGVPTALRAVGRRRGPDGRISVASYPATTPWKWRISELEHDQ